MKNSQRGFAPVVLIIILALLAGGGYAAYKSYVERVKPCCAPLHSENDRCFGDCSKTDATNILDWKTYRNEKYGFEFKYPQSYTAKTENNSRNTIVFASDNLVFGVFVPSEQDRLGDDNEHNLRFSGNGLLFRQILSTFKFTK